MRLIESINKLDDILPIQQKLTQLTYNAFEGAQNFFKAHKGENISLADLEKSKKNMKIQADSLKRLYMIILKLQKWQ